MLVTDLRARLLEESKLGRKPAVAVLTVKDFDELLADLTVKPNVFGSIVLFDVQVVIDSQILRLTEKPESTPVQGFTA